MLAFVQHAAEVVQGKMYVIGGNYNGRYLNDIQVVFSILKGLGLCPFLLRDLCIRKIPICMFAVQILKVHNFSFFSVG